jgi:hypothetical protein
MQPTSTRDALLAEGEAHSRGVVQTESVKVHVVFCLVQARMTHQSICTVVQGWYWSSCSQHLLFPDRVGVTDQASWWLCPDYAFVGYSNISITSFLQVVHGHAIITPLVLQVRFLMQHIVALRPQPACCIQASDVAWAVALCGCLFHINQSTVDFNAVAMYECIWQGFL